MKKPDLYTSPLKKDATATVMAKYKKEQAGKKALKEAQKDFNSLVSKFKKEKEPKQEEIKPLTFEDRMKAVADKMQTLNQDIKFRSMLK